MKTALSALALVVVTASAGLAGEKPVVPAKGVTKSAPSKCSNCGKAPCQCGFSPSYYTHYRKPVRPVAKHAPIVPHWTQPTTRRIPYYSSSSSAVVPTPRKPRTVPAVAPRQSRGYDEAQVHDCAPALRLGTLVPAPRRGAFVPTRNVKSRLGYVPASSCTNTYRKGPTPSTLVPTPRRPSAVPSRTPRQSLGYVPSRSWSQRLRQPRFRK